MKLEMNTTNRAIAAVIVLAVLAGAFWLQLLSPKREEVRELGKEVDRLEASLAQHEAEIAEAEAARADFPQEYQRLVVVGKAVPGDDDIASFLVQLNRIADRSDGSFRDLALTASGGEAAATPPPTSTGGEPVPATELAASLLPLGATIGPAGLAVMPYDVTFDGNFFGVADFIEGLDSLVKTNEDKVTVDGRLVTIDSFTLQADAEKGFPALEASFVLTTYLTPPAAEAAGDAAPGAPAPSAATPAAASIGGAP